MAEQELRYVMTNNGPNCVRWFPIDNPPKASYLEGLYDDREGFRVLLKENLPIGRWFRMSFAAPLAYKKTGDDCFDEDLRDIKANEWVFYKMESSSWLRWFDRCTSNIYAPYNISHYVIASLDETIEVITAIDPVGCWLSSRNE